MTAYAIIEVRGTPLLLPSAVTPTNAPRLYEITRNGLTIREWMRPTTAQAHVAAGRLAVPVAGVGK